MISYFNLELNFGFIFNFAQHNTALKTIELKKSSSFTIHSESFARDQQR